MQLKVILGLGNPGPEYEDTRHNVGWWVLDHLADVWHFDGWRRDGDARVASGRVGKYQVRLVRPTTYYNLVGNTLRPYLKRVGWQAKSDLLVVGDDLALPIGSMRFRAKGSAGGNNGLKSVEGVLKSQEYARLRLGTEPEDPRRMGGDKADFVLSPFGKHERKVVAELMPRVVEGVECWMAEGIEGAMNRFNR
ncbi:MAG TPA: aminoacyl-tRNA hydrolase, partial [Gemmatimonadaceae bacterium]